MFGVGFPEDTHFNETDGPGCIVCLMKRYVICGGVSENIFIVFKTVFVRFWTASKHKYASSWTT